MTTPDLTLYYVIHRAMKGDAERLARSVAAMEPGDRRRAAAAGRWYDGYLHELHEHHTIEDEFFFPALAARVPVFADQLWRVDAEHHSLGELLDGTEKALAALADAAEPWEGAHAEAVEVTRALADLLHEHLTFEDDDILPLFTRHMDAEEYEAIEKRAMGKPDLKLLLFTVPWVVDWATDEEFGPIFDAAPGVMKVIWYLRRGAYARLSRKVFAGVAKDDLARAARR